MYVEHTKTDFYFASVPSLRSGCFALTGHSVGFRPMAGDSEQDSEDKDGDEQDSDSGDSDDNADLKDKDGKERDSFTRAEIEAARAQAAKSRQAATQAKKDAETLRLKIKEFEDKDKSELQKAQERVAELQKQNSDLEKNSNFKAGYAVAVKFDAIDADVVARLVDSESEETIEQQVKSLRKSKPYLFKSVEGDSDGGKGKERGRGKEQGASMNDLIRGVRSR